MWSETSAAKAVLIVNWPNVAAMDSLRSAQAATTHKPIKRSHRRKLGRVAHLECRGFTLLLRMRERFESYAGWSEFSSTGMATRQGIYTASAVSRTVLRIEDVSRFGRNAASRPTAGSTEQT